MFARVRRSRGANGRRRASAIAGGPVPIAQSMNAYGVAVIRAEAGENRLRYAACDLLEEAGSGSRGRPSSRSSLLLLLMICPSSWSAVPSSVNGT